MSRKITTLLDRFFNKVLKTNTCWEWTGCRQKNGYGKIGAGGDRGKTLLAHRVSWILHCGKINEGLECCHKCDNPSCVNPNHLFLGTRIDNEEDKKNKKRHLYGEKHSMSKINTRDVVSIKTKYKINNTTQYQLAKEYGITQSQVSRIINGKRWAEGILQLA